MAEGLMDAIRALLSGGGGQQKPPVDPNEGIDMERPWDSPVLKAPPGTAMPRPAPSPTPTPAAPMTSTADDALALAQELKRRHDLMKRVLPQEMWNR